MDQEKAFIFVCMEVPVGNIQKLVEEVQLIICGINNGESNIIVSDFDPFEEGDGHA